MMVKTFTFYHRIYKCHGLNYYPPYIKRYKNRVTPTLLFMYKML
jgi:hypothetical protein